MTISFKDIPENRRYGYYRVSSKEQARNSSLDTQKSELIRVGVPEHNIRTEVGFATESIKKQPIFYNLIENQLKDGDCLIITKIDRCSRNTLSFLQLKSQFSEKHVHFRFLELPEKYFKESPSDKFVSTALAAIAEFEAARRLKRQIQGIEAAKKKNKYKGQKTVINNELIKKVEKYYNLKVPVTEIAQITGRSRSTIYKVLKEELGYISNCLVKQEETNASK